MLSSTVIDPSYQHNATPHLPGQTNNTEALSSEGMGDLSVSEVDEGKQVQSFGTTSRTPQQKANVKESEAIQAFKVYRTMTHLGKPTPSTLS